MPNIYVSWNPRDATTRTIVTNWAGIVHILTDVVVWESGEYEADKSILIAQADIVVLIVSGKMSNSIEREMVAAYSAGRVVVCLCAGERATPPEPHLPGVHVFDLWEANAVATARNIITEIPCQPQRIQSILAALVALLYLE
jgi:hypothetical protein